MPLKLLTAHPSYPRLYFLSEGIDGFWMDIGAGELIALGGYRPDCDYTAFVSAGFKWKWACFYVQPELETRWLGGKSFQGGICLDAGLVF